MNKELSTYLDLLRIGAAATVFLGHLSWMAVSGGFLWQAQPYGHSAVMVFFVLSGFVISYAADVKERSLFDFSVARLARLYSVVVPAILLTLFCDTIGIHHNPAGYDLERETGIWWRIPAGLLFLTQSWNHTSLLSNEPFWSLPYEFWYYVIFASLTFLKGTRRLIALAASCAIAGPAILLMGPIWAAGALAYRLIKHVALQKNAARLLWALTATGSVLVFLLNVKPHTSVSPFLPPSFSVLDFVLGGLLAANIFAASFLSPGLARIHAPVARLAGMTFALYLFHLPLLYLLAEYLPKHWPVPLRGAVEAALVLAIVYLLSFVTEGQKRRWRSAIRRLLGGAPEAGKQAA